MATMPGTKVSKVPPDGGYGWIVTLAYAMNNTLVLPLIANFALVFREAFNDTGLSATQGNLVTILNHSNGMFFSLFGGPILRRFGYRKVAVVGALFISVGLMLTALSNSFLTFFISYSIINSMGIAAVMAAFSLAINSYFKENRGKAIGIAMSLTGLGAVLTPQLKNALLSAYGWRYAVLILGAICLHSLAAACLLRPVKWYLKTPASNEESAPLHTENDAPQPNGSAIVSKPENQSMTILNESITPELLSAKSTSMRTLPVNNLSINSRNAISHPDIRNKTAEILTSDQRYKLKLLESEKMSLGSVNMSDENENIKNPNTDYKNEEKLQKTTIFKHIVEMFDLTLLTDPKLVSIILGLSIAGGVETNFSLAFAFIMGDMLKFETSEIAMLMSIIAFSDTIFRFAAPFIGEWCHRPPRVMYAVSLLLAVFFRSIMLFTTTYTGMILVALAMGVTKGIRTVYMNVVIPSYVPIERLAFATGIQMFFNGITIITIGPLIGRIRDLTGSYKLTVVMLNIITLMTILLWIVEFFYFKCKNNSTGKTPA